MHLPSSPRRPSSLVTGVDSFKNRLDKQWSNEDILYDYKAAPPAGRKPFAPAGTQDLTIEAKACSHEAT